MGRSQRHLYQEQGVASDGSGFPAVVDPDGGEPEEEEFRILGFNPAAIPAGYPDLSVEVVGQGFEDSAVVNFDGTDMATEFVSATRLRILCPSSTASVGNVPVTVSQGSHVTEPVDFNFIEEPVTTRRRKKAE